MNKVAYSIRLQRFSAWLDRQRMNAFVDALRELREESERVIGQCAVCDQQVRRKDLFWVPLWRLRRRVERNRLTCSQVCLHQMLWVIRENQRLKAQRSCQEYTEWPRLQNQNPN